MFAFSLTFNEKIVKQIFFFRVARGLLVHVSMPFRGYCYYYFFLWKDENCISTEHTSTCFSDDAAASCSILSVSRSGDDTNTT